MHPWKSPAFSLVASLMLVSSLRAELRLPAIIGDHMVLQQNQANPIWGWDRPGALVAVTFAGETYTATAGADGAWRVRLAAMSANASPQTLSIGADGVRREIHDVVVGEVWMCSGQSNMGFQLGWERNGDIDAAASNLPNLRLIKVPNRGTQELQNNFEGEWRAATPESARTFSAIGLIYGRYLHQILGVPVGLIHNAWGGSAAEAWIRRSSLEGDLRFAALMESTVKREAELQSEQGRAAFEKSVAEWKIAAATAKAANEPPPRAPVDWLAWRTRPGNIFAGVVHPTLGYGIRGVIWYQGEENAKRACEYADLFPFLIEQWRKEWGQGDFPFYWVQLADFRSELPKPGESAWAELREAQTQALRLPNTGQAIAIDLGEGKDIHPKNKHDVAVRLVRWALARTYGYDLPHRSPEFRQVSFEGNKAVLSFDCFGSSLRPYDVEEVRGFAVCGADRIWHWAIGSVVGGDRVEVWSDAVAAPTAVRYAWADNPVCNLYSADGLPVTPFRTDDFRPTTKP